MQKYLRISALFVSVLFLCQHTSAQNCTDPQATNYNPAATFNDGSCIYPYTHYLPPLRAVLPETIHESSGLQWTDGKLWTHNDSGDPNEIYSVDTTTGVILQTVTVDNYPNIDWEDITADANYLYIGDHGNNNGTRTDLRVLKIAKADIGTGSSIHVNAQAINFSYADQTSFTPSSSNNFDCEALISINDSLYIFTKDRGDLHTRVYKMPKTPGTYVLNPFTSYNVDGLITGADYNATTHEVALIGYMGDHTDAFMWFLNDYQSDLFFTGNKRRIEIGGPKKWQTEGITFVSNNNLFISCETTSDDPASLYTVDKGYAISAVMNVANTGSNVTIYPNPATDALAVHHVPAGGTYTIINAIGQQAFSGNLTEGDNNLPVTQLMPGVYLLHMQFVDGTMTSGTFIRQ